MYVVIAIVAVVAVIGVILGVRYLAPEWPHGANGVPNGDGNGVPRNGQSSGRDIVDGTSLSFSMRLTNGDIGDFAWLAKDIGTDEFTLRIEGLLYGFDIGYIINGEPQRAPGNCATTSGSRRHLKPGMMFGMGSRLNWT
jgi:hypothetical protein